MAINTMISRLFGSPVEEPRLDILETTTAICEEFDEIERRRKAARFCYNQAADACGETLEHRAIASI